MPLILASTSPYRQELFSRFGLPFEAVAPGIDEVGLTQPDWLPQQTAVELAKAKALAVVDQYSHATVIGSDQVATYQGRTLGKPATAERAYEQLRFLAGHEHQLLTAVAVWKDGQILTHLDITTLAMRSLSDEEIHRYVAADNPVDCCGSYKLESLGISLFERVQSDDPTAMIGMPLVRLAHLLRQFGWEVP